MRRSNWRSRSVSIWRMGDVAPYRKSTPSQPPRLCYNQTMPRRAYKLSLAAFVVLTVVIASGWASMASVRYSSKVGIALVGFVGGAGIAVFLLLPFELPGVYRTRIRNRRREHGLRLTCGYDLTGNISGVCPECGTSTGD